jgi:hypothetical protein
MTREELLLKIASREVEALPPERRSDLLLDWWTLGPEDPGWGELPPELRSELQTRDEPEDARDTRYDPLLRLALARGYQGMRNEYLQRKARALGIGVEAVQGEPELLEVCPCCLHRTLKERSGYDICPVCLWEDDGQRWLDEYSHPNKMTLREGRSHFTRLAASSPRVQELREAYPRQDEDAG